MRAILDFPNGFGTDPTLMMGPSGPDRAAFFTQSPSALARESSETVVEETPALHVPGPFKADVGSGAPSETVELAAESGGFRPRVLGLEDEGVEDTVCREPQSVVVTTMIVGVVLAAMVYFLDIR